MSFPRYERYRDSRVEWLGEIPSHWTIRPLKHLVWLKGGGTPSKENPGYWQGDVPWASAKDLKSNYLEDTIDHITQMALQDGTAQTVATGSVIVLVRGMMLARTFPVCRTAVPMAINQDLKALESRPGLLNDYLAWMLRGSEPETLNRLDEAGHGTKALRMEAWLSMSMPEPPLSEQSRIAAFLDRETGKIDALVAEQRRLIELLKEKRQAVISHAVTKGLDPTAPMKDSGVKWLGEAPAHWRVSRLKFLAHIQTGVAKGKDVAGRVTTEVPYLRVANVQDGHIDLNELATLEMPVDDVARYLLQPGDVLMNEGGDFDKLGRGAIWDGRVSPCIHQNHVFAVRPFGVSAEWLNLVTGSDSAQFFFMSRSKQSTNLASISSTNIMELPLLVPPEAEQQEVLAYVEQQLGNFDALVAEAGSAITLFQERRAALISAAVTGKLDVRGFAPSDKEDSYAA